MTPIFPPEISETPETNTRPAFGIHAGDYAAWYLHATGRWIVNCRDGTITDTRTGESVRFSQNNSGYLRTTVSIYGIPVFIYKHRAIWAVAAGILALPCEYDLEVDHINHDKCDCRIRNLRLVTHAQNAAFGRKSVPAGVVRKIREEYAKGGVTQSSLAQRNGIAAGTVHRIVRGKTYRGVSP